MSTCLNYINILKLITRRVKRRFVLSKVEGKQSPKNNRNAKEINYHELFENPGEIASPPAGGSQNPYTYYALTVCMNF